MSNAPIKDVVIRSERGVVLVRLISILSLFAVCVIGLDRTPPPWWDEGWTLVVAKTLALHDLYGGFLNGEPGPMGLSASPPTTMLVALVFRVFGVGLFQARLLMASLTLVSLAALYVLVSRLYDRRMALATWVIVSLMSMHPQANPITMGRQVLAEPLMLLLLVVGALFFFMALQRSLWFLVPALLCWGVVNIVKAQVLPFWTVSLAVPFAVTLFKRQWRIAIIFGIGLAGGYLVYQQFLVALDVWLSPRIIAGTQVTGLVETVAFVPVLANRLLALSTIVKFELPLVLGLAYTGWSFLRRWNRRQRNENAEAVQLSLWSFAASWLAWYLLLANGGIPRYLYPPAFVGSIFVAVLLRDLTEGFDLGGTFQRAALALRSRGFAVPGVRALFAFFLVALAVPFTLLIFLWFFTVDTNTAAQQMAQYIDSHVSQNALVESYDSELFFFLSRPYHYPPDQTHVDLIRRTGDPSIRIDYDPLAANPDYLVVGPFGEGWHVYDEVLAGQAFHLVTTVDAYRLYERVR